LGVLSVFVAERITTLDPAKYEELRFDRRNLVKNPQFKASPLVVNTLRVNDAYSIKIKRKHTVRMETSKARALQLEFEAQASPRIDVLAQVETAVAAQIVEELPELSLVPALSRKMRGSIYVSRPMPRQRSPVA